MIEDLLKPVLVIVIGFLLRWFFAYINVQIDEALFNTIVAGIVLWLLTLLGVNTTIRVRAYFVAQRLKAK